MFSRLFFLTVFVMLSFSVTATAQQQRFDSAEATDPNKLKWMQGFPPPADKIITHPESDFFSNFAVNPRPIGRGYKAIEAKPQRP